MRGKQTPHEPEGTPYIFYEHITKMYLSTADCMCISGFWGLLSQRPTGALPLDPAGGLPSLRPHVPTLPPDSGYANTQGVIFL